MNQQSLLRMIGKELIEPKRKRLSLRPNALKRIGDNLWSCQEDGISIFNSNLKLLRTFNHLGAMDVASLANGNIVIAGYRYLKEISPTGKLLKPFLINDNFVDSIFFVFKIIQMFIDGKYHITKYDILINYALTYLHLYQF